MTPSPRRYRQKKDRASDLQRKFVRMHECALWNNPISPCDIDHPIEPAHYRTAANSGAGYKPGDEWLLPLCRAHHREQHQIGQHAFEQRYGISMRDLALAYARESPDREIRERAKALAQELT